MEINELAEPELWLHYYKTYATFSNNLPNPTRSVYYTV